MLRMELDSLVVADGVGDLERQTKSLKSLMGLGVGGSWVWFGHFNNLKIHKKHIQFK